MYYNLTRLVEIAENLESPDLFHPGHRQTFVDPNGHTYTVEVIGIRTKEVQYNVWMLDGNAHLK